jgi:hypothetical protein
LAQRLTRPSNSHDTSLHLPTDRLTDLPTFVTYWRPDLLQQTGGVHLGLEFDDLAAVDGEERDAGELDWLPGRGEPQQIAVMRSARRPARGDPVALGDDLVKRSFQIG